jgi:hypothetical protein
MKIEVKFFPDWGQFVVSIEAVSVLKTERDAVTVERGRESESFSLNLCHVDKYGMLNEAGHTEVNRAIQSVMKRTFLQDVTALDVPTRGEHERLGVDRRVIQLNASEPKTEVTC